MIDNLIYQCYNYSYNLFIVIKLNKILGQINLYIYGFVKTDEKH